MELKSGEGTVGVADRDRCCNDGCCCNGRNSGWGSGWGAVGGAILRTASKRLSVSLRTLLKTRKLPVSTE